MKKENYSIVLESRSINLSTCEDSQLLHITIVFSSTSKTARKEQWRIKSFHSLSYSQNTTRTWGRNFKNKTL